MRERIIERGKTSGRVDDNEEVILKRFNTYKNHTWPVIENYGKEGGDVFEVNSYPCLTPPHTPAVKLTFVD
jgi:adenylate kinase family enzyme